MTSGEYDLHKAIAEYAAHNAGSCIDLDEDLEPASIEFLMDDEWGEPVILI